MHVLAVGAPAHVALEADGATPDHSPALTLEELAALVGIDEPREHQHVPAPEHANRSATIGDVGGRSVVLAYGSVAAEYEALHTRAARLRPQPSRTAARASASAPPRW